MSGRVSQRSQIQDFLLASAHAGAHPVLREVALKFAVSLMTVSKARRELIAAGLLPEPPRSARAGRPRIRRGNAPIVADPRAGRPASPTNPTSPPEPGRHLMGEDLPVRALPEGMVGAILAAATGPALSLDEQRERLSWLAQNAAREEVQISALSTLARLDAMAGIRSGPSSGAVLTEEDAVDHLSLLMRANGRSRVDRALLLAFPPSQ